MAIWIKIFHRKLGTLNSNFEHEVRNIFNWLGNIAIAKFQMSEEVKRGTPDVVYL